MFCHRYHALFQDRHYLRIRCRRYLDRYGH